MARVLKDVIEAGGYRADGRGLRTGMVELLGSVHDDRAPADQQHEGRGNRQPCGHAH
jgi:hypothetical protein